MLMFSDNQYCVLDKNRARARMCREPGRISVLAFFFFAGLLGNPKCSQIGHLETDFIDFSTSSWKCRETSEFRRCCCLLLTEPSRFQLVTIKSLAQEPHKLASKIYNSQSTGNSVALFSCSQSLLFNLDQQICSWTLRPMSIAQFPNKFLAGYWGSLRGYRIGMSPQFSLATNTPFIYIYIYIL
jgi:hypothetical protein